MKKEEEIDFTEILKKSCLHCNVNKEYYFFSCLVRVSITFNTIDKFNLVILIPVHVQKTNLVQISNALIRTMLASKLPTSSTICFILQERRVANDFKKLYLCEYLSKSWNQFNIYVFSQSLVSRIQLPCNEINTIRTQAFIIHLNWYIFACNDLLTWKCNKKENCYKV